MINMRIGMKVECIKPCALLCGYDRIGNTELPKVGTVYTVDGFQDVWDGEPGIHLLEIETKVCGCRGGKRSPWPLVNFRPIIEDQSKTKATVEEIIRKAKEAAPPVEAPKPKVTEPV